MVLCICTCTALARKSEGASGLVRRIWRVFCQFKMAGQFKAVAVPSPSSAGLQMGMQMVRPTQPMRNYS